MDMKNLLKKFHRIFKLKKHFKQKIIIKKLIDFYLNNLSKLRMLKIIHLRKKLLLTYKLGLFEYSFF
jgi:hypothetical protein